MEDPLQLCIPTSITPRGRYSLRLYDEMTENYPLEIAGKSDLEFEWTLETDGINLKVMCINRVDHTRTYSNNCVEIFQTWVLKPDVLPCSQSFGTSSNLTVPT